jgi:type II secretory pathway pseudopilin PulG
MRIPLRSHCLRQAFTLLEMTVVLLVILALTRVGFVSSKKMTEWKLGRAASETLRSVHTAQRLYLADNPIVSVSSLTSGMIVPYLPNNVTTMPTVRALSGANLSILVNVSPPVINAGGGVVYDPSGNSKDSLWDVGQ